MKRFHSIIILTAISVCAAAADLNTIVPMPSRVEEHKGSMRVSGVSIKCDSEIGQDAIKAVSLFATRLNLVCGKTSTVSTPIGLSSSLVSNNAKGIIFIKDNSLAEEEYTILVNPHSAIVKANGYNGFFYAIQTIMQLLPEDIYSCRLNEKARWALPCCYIQDKPRFSYRGALLDVSRHFWSVDEVRKYLDVMAMFKLNKFHWHLTDDQGWRIESKKYPLLTQIGGYRAGTMIGHDFDSNDHIRYGGFYTQDEIKETVAYAGSLGIEVIPEIDLPGHMLGAMSAYPWLGCTGGPYSTWTRWGISDQVLCVGKESTFTFLEDILSEIAELFPSEYFHIGGDECPKKEWEKCPDCQAKIKELGLKDDDSFSAEQYLQSYVTARLQKFLATKGKRIIGWDEIMEGSLEPGVTIMSWRGAEGGRKAATKGYDVIMCPTTNCYINFCQAEDFDLEPLSYTHWLPIEKVYELDPTEGIEPDKQHHIIGAQCNLWTEYIDNLKLLEYMALPRLLAGAEVQWCIPENKDFGRFKKAVVEHEFPVLHNAGYFYSKVIMGIYGASRFQPCGRVPACQD